MLNLLSKKSTKGRGKRGYAITTSKWESDDTCEPSSEGGAPEASSSTTTATRDPGSEPKHTHVAVSHSGIATYHHAAGHQSGGHRFDSDVGFEALLPSSIPSTEGHPPPPSSSQANNTVPSLLPYEFNIARFGEDSVLDDPKVDISAGADKSSRRVQPTPGELQKEWVDAYRDDYLREMVWLEGRGVARGEKVVCGCGKDREAVYRCKTCIGTDLLCKECMIQLHRQDPFHFIESWNGQFFEDSTLKSIGLRIQLGHPSHSNCPGRKEAFNDDFVVLDVTGIHEVGLDFCGCELKKDRHIQLLRSELFPGTSALPRSAVTFRALKFFQIMSFESKGSHEEFYNTLVRLTGNVNPKLARDRYHEFIVVVSLWRHLKMLKRAGRGHDVGGVKGTSLGDCAIRCPACPQPGVNLPPDWELACPEKSWLYRLFVAIDGNFRLKRRMVSSEERDPGLNEGWAYFVNEKNYKTHLAQYWNSAQEKSTCVAHDAVDKPDREARGLAASGVVIVVCSRHEFRLPNGLGDLQKGERYNNVDFVAFSGIRWFKLREIVISYDIACQWHKRLIERLGLLPDSIQPSSVKSIVFAIPKFHLPAHIEYCHRTFSFNLIPGVGRSDGEAPERGWSVTNAIGKSTIEMGPGTRRDTVDDHSGNLNFTKTKKLGASLFSKLLRAIAGRKQHVELFSELLDSLPPQFVERWLAEVKTWEASPATERNPYEVEVKGVTEKQIRLELAREAEEEEKSAISPTPEGEGNVSTDNTRGIHPSLFVAQGLQLEDDQRKLAVAVSVLGNHPTAKQLSTLAERSNTLRRRIAAWFELQKVYTPEAEMQRLQHQMSETAIDGKSATETYDIALHLPSTLDPAACTKDIRDYEAKLRQGQAYDALDDIRRYLRIRAYLYKRKDKYARGVAQNTRANTAIKRAQAGVDQAFEKYNRSRAALVSLWGETTPENRLTDAWRKDLLPLKKAEVRGMSEGLMGESEGRRTISWIWLSRPTLVAEDDDIENDVQLQDVLRLEFLKCRARAMRWSEEVELLNEEMRRTLEFFAWKWRWWMCRTRSALGESRGDGYEEGFAAYAFSQAAVFQQLYDGCKTLWSSGAEEALKKAQAEDVQVEDDD